MNEHANAVKAALEGSDTGMGHFLTLLEETPGDFSMLIEAINPTPKLEEHKVQAYKQLIIDFNNLDLSRYLAKDIYAVMHKRCNLTFKGDNHDEAEALLTLYLIHRLKEGFNKGYLLADLDLNIIEEYLQAVL